MSSPPQIQELGHDVVGRSSSSKLLDSGSHPSGQVGIPDEVANTQPRLSQIQSGQERQSLNTLEDLSKGIVKTRLNNLGEYTILLVGETGTGKTTFLSLLANILEGRSPNDYVSVHSEENESGTSEKESQTNLAKVYEFESKNGVKVRILDTPGLADTRGLAQDEEHKTNIAETITSNISIVNAVLILVNGTVPRLGVAMEYTLSTLSSMFPHSLITNIGFIFTNVSHQLLCNFNQESLPEKLRRIDNRFFLDNPLAMWKRYASLSRDAEMKKRALAELRSTIQATHRNALKRLTSLFDWLDTLEPQPTKEIWSLFEKSQDIERSIGDVLARARQLAGKKEKLEAILRDVNETELTIVDYQRVVRERVWIRAPTPAMNTMCLVTDCYSNCQVNQRDLGIKSNGLLLLMGIGIPPAYFCFPGYTLATVGIGIFSLLLRPRRRRAHEDCLFCGHPLEHHQCDRMEWRQVDDEKIIADLHTQKKQIDTTAENGQLDMLKSEHLITMQALKGEMTECLDHLGLLTKEYTKLSLLDSVSGQIRKTAILLELNLEAMKNGDGDLESVGRVEERLKYINERLRVIEEVESRMATSS